MLVSDDFVDGLIDAIQSAFNSLKRHYKIQEKAQYDYVSDVDKTLEAVITKYIKGRFPEHDIVGEETVGSEFDLGGPTWVIDPLDGTSNFLFGVPFYSSSVAFVFDSEVKFGLVIDLSRKEVFSAERGLGAQMDGRPMSKLENESDFIGVSTGFLDIVSGECPTLISELKAMGKFRLLGSQALHLCYVASGRLKACVNVEAKIWDDIAGSFILSEAGGRYSSQIGFHPNSVAVKNTCESIFSIGESSQNERITTLIRKNFSG